MIPIAKRMLSLLAGLAAFAVFACPIPSASAAEYDVWSCRGPVGQPLSTEAWTARASDAVVGDVTFSNGCATGGPVALGISPSSSGTRRPRLEYVFDLPRGEKITSYRLLRGFLVAASGPGYAYVSAIREVTGGTVYDYGCASYIALPNFNCGTAGSLTDPSDSSNVVDVNSVNLDELGVFVSCIATGGCASPFSFAADAVLFGSRVTIEDNNPPTLAEIGGSLAGGRPVYGDASLFVRAVDDNAGISSISLAIDGAPYQMINIDSGACSQPYVRARPCPADAGRNFEVDSSTLSEGNHQLSGTITDAAGNQTPYGPVNFTVKKPEPEPSNGSPAVHEPVLQIDPGSVWHRVGTRKKITGSLTTPGGLPVAGADLRVQLSDFKSNWSEPRDLPTVTTGTDGRFTFEVGGQGSRRITVGFSPGSGQIPTAQATTEAKTRLQLAFKVNPRKLRKGKTATFRGRLKGAGPAAKGIPLLIQAKVAGKWSTIETTSTRKAGNYSWKYRFRYVEREALFSFRVLVGNGPGWPWPETKSPVRKVRVKVPR